MDCAGGRDLCYLEFLRMDIDTASSNTISGKVALLCHLFVEVDSAYEDLSLSQGIQFRFVPILITVLCNGGGLADKLLISGWRYF